MDAATYAALYGGQQTTPGWYNQANQGYSQLLSQIRSGLQGVGQSQSQAIADTYAQQQGQAAQQLASQGLGNTTVTESTQRGLTLDEQKAQVALQNQLAQLQAGYTAQLGSSQLGFQTQFAQQQQQFANQQQMYGTQYAQQYALAALQKQPFGSAGGFGQPPSRDPRAYGYTNVGGY